MVVDLDDIIETFKARCFSYLSEDDTEWQATTLMLILLLLGRYMHSYLIQDLRDAITYWTSLRLQPLEAFCLDLVFLGISLEDRDPIRMNQSLIEAKRSHHLICQCDHGKDLNTSNYEEAGWLNIKPVRRQCRLDRYDSQFVLCIIQLPPQELLSSFDVDNFILDTATLGGLEMYRLKLLYQIYDHHRYAGL